MKIAAAILAMTLTGAGWAGPWEQHLLASDRLAQGEAPELQAVYQEAGVYLARGEVRQALVEYDYAAFSGSLAAALRLCVIEAYGLGVEGNELKAAFWCGRAEARGYREAGFVSEWLYDNYWVASR